MTSKKTTKKSSAKKPGAKKVAGKAVDQEVERGKKEAAKRMTPSEVDKLDVDAIRRIAKAAADVERREGELAHSRRVVNERVAKAKANLRATIEASGNVVEGDPKDAKKKLDQILSAHQDCDEAEAERKMELHEALDAKRKARAALRKAFDNARQAEIDFGKGGA